MLAAAARTTQAHTVYTRQPLNTQLGASIARFWVVIDQEIHDGVRLPPSCCQAD